MSTEEVCLGGASIIFEEAKLAPDGGIAQDSVQSGPTGAEFNNKIVATLMQFCL
jgi:hypothetical protein